MTDLVTFGETPLRVSPPGNERLETAQEARLFVDGTESNVAVAAARLETDTTWCSKLPDNPLGHRVVSELQSNGVTTEATWTDEGRQGLTFHEVGAPPREDQTVHDRAGAAAASSQPGDLPMDVIQQADGVFVGGTSAVLSENLAETAEAALRAGSGSGGITALDLDFQPALWADDSAGGTLQGLFEHVNVLITNEVEARTVLGMSGQPRELAHTIASEWDFEYVVVTRSGRGALAFHDNVIHEQEATETEIVDESGQHAAFVGAFLDRLINGAECDVALAYGVAMAALTRTIPGPLSTVDQAEVEHVVEEMADTGTR